MSSSLYKIREFTYESLQKSNKGDIIMKKFTLIKFIVALIIPMALLITSCGEPPSQITTKQVVTMNSTQPASEPTGPVAWPYNLEKEVQRHSSYVSTVTDSDTKNIVLILDGSGSMKGDKMDTAKRAVETWTGKVPSDANLSLVAFHRGGWEIGRLQVGDRKPFISTVKSISAGGGTGESE